jgi:hypothetical protein
MKVWGWTNPVLADEAGGIIAGHARILAARQLRYGEVPVTRSRAVRHRAGGEDLSVQRQVTRGCLQTAVRVQAKRQDQN